MISEENNGVFAKIFLLFYDPVLYKKCFQIIELIKQSLLNNY